MQSFLLCFVPMFFAVDPMGLLPVYSSITAKLDPIARRRIGAQAVPAALVIGVGFFVLGDPLLKWLGIGLSDLQIAGGALLFLLAMLDLVVAAKPSVDADMPVGLIPLATPLIAGPGVLTLGLVLVGRYGYAPTIAAYLANLAALALLLLSHDLIVKIIPLHVMRAGSKVVMLILAAIGVAMVRQGVIAAIRG